jgi:CheY-like chemotaxis protein
VARLEAAGHAVEVATEVDDAMRRASVEPADVVLCDIDSPAIDVHRLTAELRAMAPAPVALVALSRYDGALTRLRVEEAGFDQVLTQPVTDAGLARCLSGLPAAVPLRHRGA